MTEVVQLSEQTKCQKVELSDPGSYKHLAQLDWSAGVPMWNTALPLARLQIKDQIRKTASSDWTVNKYIAEIN